MIDSAAIYTYYFSKLSRLPEGITINIRTARYQHEGCPNVPIR